MAQTISDVMTPDPIAVSADTPIAEVARQMRDNDVGAILVTDGGSVSGIVTDRDITVRAVADGRDASSTQVSDVATMDVTTLSASGTVDDAVRTMQGSDVRRLPVVDDGGRPVGIVSLGDISIEKDAGSALADISSAPPNN